MHINQLSGVIVDILIHMHKELGPGLFESVYEEVLASELDKREIGYRRQQVIPIVYDDVVLVENAFKADIIVDNRIIIELKSIDQLSPVHYKQLLTYLRLTGIKLGLLVNFNEVLIKDGIHRVVNNL
ncbi:MAG TPA: GxxExxY protein [Chitinophagales bacterium]|nr:GxxExxY protein [Chitinophagales bacterium]HMX05057.1 GxxExxY protein [Chitinophagales bacterium]HMZ88763.1 GxxExxY protein [Chitinophagales bacterium]HNA58933.1 GxxExxY protein [Chitinophagales bacterium]HNE45504.1 GxxExxY protein [Chitinophagales bacterium]